MHRCFNIIEQLILGIGFLAVSVNLYSQEKISEQAASELGIPKETLLYKVADSDVEEGRYPSVCVWKHIWLGRISDGGILAKIDLSRSFIEGDIFILYLDVDNNKLTGRVDEGGKGIDYWLACMLEKRQTGTYKALDNGKAVKEGIRYEVYGDKLYLYSPTVVLPTSGEQMLLSTLCQKGDPVSPEAYFKTKPVEINLPR